MTDHAVDVGPPADAGARPWFHVYAGLYFRRTADGAVDVGRSKRVEPPPGTSPSFERVETIATIDANSWASVVSNVSTPGETHLTYEQALAFHQGERRSPRCFYLHRHEDPSGVSGVGVVAEGVEFSDGTVALRWLGEWPVTTNHHDRGVESVQALHGHGGRTEVVWLDAPA